MQDVASSEKSLAEILADRARAGVPVPVPLALAILRKVCDALDHMHNLRDASGQWIGMIHGDVSPAQIFVGEDGQVRLAPRTQPHGTLPYLAPEYISFGMMDTRSDLFSLGAIAHEMLTNRPLFAGDNDNETRERVCLLAIPAPSSLNPEVSPDIDGIVLLALARDPAYRWQAAAMMLEGLTAVTQRLGFEIGPDQADAWGELLSRKAPARAVSVATAMELEIGPEPTQVGSMPLISFGETRPFAALIGEQAARPSAPVIKQPIGTFVANRGGAGRARKKWIVIGVLVAVVLGAGVAAVVLFAL
jgi:hypothetical protein